MLQFPLSFDENDKTSIRVSVPTPQQCVLFSRALHSHISLPQAQLPRTHLFFRQFSYFALHQFYHCPKQNNVDIKVLNI
jgi:hypothetical protein